MFATVPSLRVIKYVGKRECLASGDGLIDGVATSWLTRFISVQSSHLVVAATAIFEHNNQLGCQHQCKKKPFPSKMERLRRLLITSRTLPRQSVKKQWIDLRIRNFATANEDRPLKESAPGALAGIRILDLSRVLAVGHSASSTSWINEPNALIGSILHANSLGLWR